MTISCVLKFYILEFEMLNNKISVAPACSNLSIITDDSFATTNADTANAKQETNTAMN